MTRESLFGPHQALPSFTADSRALPTEHDAHSLTSWMQSTNISDDGVNQLMEAASTLSEAHTKLAPSQLLTDITELHGRIQELLRNGKQKLRQTRDLYRIDADLLAHKALLLGDLNRNDAAISYGFTAELCAKEADANLAISLSVQAKTERWRMRFNRSADLARRGYDCSPPTPIRVLLASQEAHAAALCGDMPRARESLQRAERSSECGTIDSGVSAWSCPRLRQAMFALAVAIRAGDPTTALRAASIATTAWNSGEPFATATWAQIRLGTGIAHIMMGDLDSTLADVSPALNLPQQFRISTVIGYASQIDKRLQQRRFLHNNIAADIRRRIFDFNRSAATQCTGL